MCVCDWALFSVLISPSIVSLWPNTVSPDSLLPRAALMVVSQNFFLPMWVAGMRCVPTLARKESPCGEITLFLNNI